MKVHEWLAANVTSHGIFDSDGLAADFAEKTGLKPTWGSYTPEQVKRMIEKRGVGGSLSKQPAPRLANGWEIAESLSETYADGKSHRLYEGRGTRFHAALSDLQKAGK